VDASTLIEMSSKARILALLDVVMPDPAGARDERAGWAERSNSA
jgi:hypothetical protein